MLSRPVERPRAAFLLGLLSALPLLAWWLGWFPALMSSDSMDQYRQAVEFDFFNFHPIAHTAALWLLTRPWQSPAMVSLVQLLAMTVALALAARRLTQAGVPMWFSVGAAWFVAALPMVAVTTITLWKDVPFTIAFVWAFAELLGMARDRDSFWASPGGPIRLGIALGALWALRANGFLTVMALLVILAVVERRRIRALVPTAVAVLGIGLVLPAILVAVLPVHPGGTEPAEVFISDIAATVVHRPSIHDADDRALIEAVAPTEVWIEMYDCTDGTPLAFDPRFSSRVMRDDPWAYRGLVVESLFQAFPTVAGHRWCAADYLILPVSRTGSFLHYPPFDIPQNELGVTRNPVSERLFAATLDLYQWVEDPTHRWLTWRPALMILLGLLTWAGVAVRRGTRALWPAGALFLIHLGNVAATTPAQEFRYAFPLYAVSLLSLPLWWLIVRSLHQPLALGVVDDGPCDDPHR